MSDAIKQEKPSRKRPASALKFKAKDAAGATPTPVAPPAVKRKALDTTRQGVRVWLVKVPVAVAEAIKNAQEGEKIGVMTVSRTTTGGGAAGAVEEEHRTEAIRLEEALCEPMELPRDFTLEAPPPEAKMPRMYALRSDDSGKGRMMVEGLVSRRTSLLPTASVDYRMFAKKRQIQHHRKERRLELIKDDRGPDARAAVIGRPKVIDLNAPIGPIDGEGGGGGAGGGAERKRPRLEGKALQTELFRVFDERHHWSLRELMQRLGQPEASLKAALKAIADYQVTGQYRGSYILKADWAQAAASSSAKLAGGGGGMM